MKTGQLILPLYDNNGHSLSIVHADLRAQLRQLFGGFTAYEGTGSWASDNGVVNEPVMVYLIAMERQRGPELRRLAGIMAREACQACVMIVTPNGDVEFVKPAPLEAPASTRKVVELPLHGC
jgi:hypothetical protein